MRIESFQCPLERIELLASFAKLARGSEALVIKKAFVWIAVPLIPWLFREAVSPISYLDHCGALIRDPTDE